MPTAPLGLSIDRLYANMVAAAEPACSYDRRRKGEGLAAWQRRLRKVLLRLLAVEARPDQPPETRCAERVHADGCVRQRGYLRAADGLAVPFYLLTPDPRPKGRMPVCIAVAGHGPGKVIPAGIAPSEKWAAQIADGQRDYGLQAAQRGYLTIIPEMRGFGELMLAEDLQQGADSSCTKLAMRAIHLGRTLLGQRIADVVQFIDWAAARDDVDSRRVVITGNSGGGMVSLFAAAVDTRIAAAVPSCYFSTFADSILAMGHCPCNYVPGLQAVAEMSDLAGLVAPRPLLIVAGAKDTIFPIDAVRRSCEKLSAIYADADAADRLELFEGADGHRYYAHRVWNFLAEKLP